MKIIEKVSIWVPPIMSSTTDSEEEIESDSSELLDSSENVDISQPNTVITIETVETKTDITEESVAENTSI